MDGWRPKGHAGTADHPGGCPGQNNLEIKIWLVRKREEEYHHISKCNKIINIYCIKGSILKNQ